LGDNVFLLEKFMFLILFIVVLLFAGAAAGASGTDLF
jgi:archaellum component FlaG (FlaF/FlaG flagellin family)